MEQPEDGPRRRRRRHPLDSKEPAVGRLEHWQLAEELAEQLAEQLAAAARSILRLLHPFRAARPSGSGPTSQSCQARDSDA